jgi:hypothetical protein
MKLGGAICALLLALGGTQAKGPTIVNSNTQMASQNSSVHMRCCSYAHTHFTAAYSMHHMHDSSAVEALRINHEQFAGAARSTHAAVCSH